jgi:acyl-CoA thioesterase FadM
VSGDGGAGRFVHVVRPRYAEVDAQGVVFNAHWLTYFDESCTRFFEWLGYEPSVAFFEEFDVMLVKAVVEWQGPAGFDDVVEIEVVRRGSATRRSTSPSRPGSTGHRCAPPRSPT